MNYGSIVRYQEIILELKEDIVKNPSLHNHWNKHIQEYRHTIEDMERAWRVVEGAER